MKSLEELNQYALSPITYIDDRPAGVFFDRGATVDQEITTNENTTFFFPYGIEIEDITQYDVAQMEYVIDLSVFDPAVVYISFPASVTLPSHISVTRVGNVFTISEIRNKADWDLVKTVRVQPPFSVSGFKPLEGKLRWFADGQAVTRTEAIWDVQLELVPVEYFSSVAAETYTANQQDDQIAVPSIIVDPDEFDPDWTLEISPSVLGAVELIYSTNPSEAETSWNASTRTFSITGDKTAVNNTLEDLEVDYGRSDADFIMTYLLRNNYNLVTENQVQTFESRDFISDMDAASGLSGTLHTIFGGEANFTPFTTFDDVDTTFSRTRDPNPATYTAVATQVADAVGIFRTGSVVEAASTVDPVDFIRYRDYSANMSSSFAMTADVEGGTFFRMTIDTSVLSASVSGRGFGFNIDDNLSYDFASANLIPDTDIYINWGDGSPVERVQRTRDSSGVITQYDNILHYYADTDAYYDVVVYGDITHLGGSPGYLDYAKNNAIGATPEEWERTYLGRIGNSRFVSTDNVIIGIDNWGDWAPTSMCGMLAGQHLVEHLPDDFPTSVTDMRGFFANNQNAYPDADLPSVTMDLGGWTVLNVTNMSNMFKNRNLGQFTQIGLWDVDNVTEMNDMFHDAINVADQDLNGWGSKTGSVENMRGMFSDSDYAPLSLNSWDTSSVTNMSLMFANNTDFNGNISSWDTSSVTTMESMFGGNTSFDQNISSWDVSSVTTFYGFMSGNAAFTGTIQSWNMSSATTIERMFDGARYEGSIEYITTSTSLTNMERAFYQHYMTGNIGTGWNTSAVTNFERAFAGGGPIASEGISASTWNPSGIDNISVASATTLERVLDNNRSATFSGINNWNVSSCSNFAVALGRCRAFNQNIGGWNMSSATNISGMFSGSHVFNNGGSDTIKNWDVSSVTNMANVFNRAYDFNQPIDDWDTSSATTMSYMFDMQDEGDGSYDTATQGYGAWNQPLNSWDTSSVTDMESMFRRCTSFNQPLNNWDTGNVTRMASMFRNCTSYDQDISGWDVSSITSAGAYSFFDSGTSSSWTDAEKPNFSV